MCHSRQGETKTMKALCIAVSVAALALEAANAGEVGFTTKPKAVRAGDKVTITFAVSAATDVAVEILGTDGTIVRHLGGAVLGGENPPPPPFGPGLAQAVPWDGRDDAGKPVHAPRKRGQAPSVKGSDPFSGLKVRVRLGLQAAFDRFIGWQDVPPLNRCSVNGLAVGPDRRLYVISIDHISPPNGRSENRLWVMSPDGKYLRTLYPYPAT